MKYILHTKKEKIIAITSASYGVALSDSTLEVESDLKDTEILTLYCVIDEKLFYIGVPPGPYYEINSKGTWVYNLLKAKEQTWLSIKASRSSDEEAGFTYAGSVFDSDPSSQARINGAVTLALIAKQTNQPYEITWTLKDSTLRTLSADEMIAVGLALGTHVQTIFNKGQQLQQQIAQATTKEQVESITW